MSLLVGLILAKCCNFIWITTVYNVSIKWMWYKNKDVRFVAGLSRCSCVVSHHCFLVGLLNGVPRYFTVSVVLWWLPLQCNIESPNIHNLQSLRGAWEIYRGEIRVTVCWLNQSIKECHCKCYGQLSSFFLPTTCSMILAVSSIFSICTWRSYFPECFLSVLRMKRIVSISVFLTLAKLELKGSPSLFHVTCGLGLPCTTIKEGTEAAQQILNQQQFHQFILAMSSNILMICPVAFKIWSLKIQNAICHYLSPD